MSLHAVSSWLLFSILFSLHAKAQLPGMRIYTRLDGYPGTTGYHISQDSKGFIWVSTNNGAVCFDGKRFRVIDDKDGLTDKEILWAQPYSEDNVILLPLLNNIALYKKGKVVTAAQYKNLSIVNNKVANRCEVDEITGKIWLSDSRNYSGIMYCFSGDSIKEVRIKKPAAFENIAAFNDRLYLMGSDSSWLFRSCGIYDLKRQTYTPLKFLDEQGKTIGAEVLLQCVVSKDRKYIITERAKNRVEVFEIRGSEARRIHRITLNHPLRSLYPDRDNNLWASVSPSGIEYLGSLSANEKPDKPLDLLDDIIINDMLTDRDGNLWFTTEQKGLCFISSRHWQNARLTLQLKLPPDPPTCISGDGKQSIYIGHAGRSGFTWVRNGSSTVFKIPEGSPGIRAILKRKEHIFIATDRLARFIENNDGIRYEGLWRRGAIKDIAVYKDEQLIIAEHDALVAIKIEDLDKAAQSRKIFDGRASSVEVLHNGGLLVGTPNGLFFKSALPEPAVRIGNNKLKAAYITDIKNAGGNFVLVGTNAQGLHIYNFVTGFASRVIFPASQSPASIRDIFCESDSIYWISTDIGVARICFGRNMDVRNITSYTFFDGLPSNDVTSVYVQHDTAYVATAAGLGILPLKRPGKKNEALKLWLTSLKIEDSLIYSPKSNIDLAYDQNDLQLSLGASHYESMGMLRFRYRLLGLSGKWTETESPEISFSGLSPGSYLFEAYALNPDGTTSETPLLVPIAIHPAFWQSPWFTVLLCMLAGVAILFAVYRLVLNKKNKQYRDMQQKKRLAELELEAIKAQINPHFVYNCLNSIQYFSYKNDIEPVKQYLNIFAKLIRQTMQYSQETFISLEEEINYLNNYLKLEKVRFKDKLNYRLEIGSGLDRLAMIPSMLVQPYVENALKHGVAKQEGTGQLYIGFSCESENRIKVTIEDNGPGLPGKIAETGRKPLGLRLSGSRAETYNQLFGLNIGISFEQGQLFCSERIKGTRVKLLIPVIKNGGALR